MTRIKASSRIEGIFAHAVAMDNRGMKNIIHCVGSSVYILNFDYSMILKFSLRKSEVSFPSPVSFNANEYDSPDFSFNVDEHGGEIIFYTASKEYGRKKICRTPKSGPDAKDVAKLYRGLKKTGEQGPYLFHLSEECVPLLEEGLSHTEISVENSKLVLRQRNVYTGTLIEVEPSRGKGFFTIDNLPENLPPIALKTKDFMSLFAARKALSFIPTEDFLMVKDSKKEDFEGILALCKYDMVIDLHQGEDEEGGEDNGRKEPEERAGKQKANRPDKAKQPQRRK